MRCLLEGRGPLLSKVYSPAGYIRILINSPFSLFIDEQTDFLDSHSDPLPSSPLFIHVALPWTPLVGPLSWCSAQQSRVQLCSTAVTPTPNSHVTDPSYSCPMFSSYPFVDHATLHDHLWFLAPSPCFLVLSLSHSGSIHPMLPQGMKELYCSQGFSGCWWQGVRGSLLKEVHSQILSTDLVNPTDLGLRTV